MQKERHEICPNCGKELIPAIECINFPTRAWDGHTYKCPCTPGIYVSIG